MTPSYARTRMPTVLGLLHDVQKRLEAADSNAEFRSAQARFEQVEAEWLEIGEALELCEVEE